MALTETRARAGSYFNEVAGVAALNRSVAEWFYDPANSALIRPAELRARSEFDEQAA
jgi:hypothetical protein